jgi:hypothetical protein
VVEDPSSDWNRAPGYYPEPLLGRECYEYRPGRALLPDDDNNVPPSCLPRTCPPLLFVSLIWNVCCSPNVFLSPAVSELYSRLGTTSRSVLEALCRALDLRSYSFSDLLDNIPLKNSEHASSTLLTVCHGRKALLG